MNHMTLGHPVARFTFRLVKSKKLFVDFFHDSKAANSRFFRGSFSEKHNKLGATNLHISVAAGHSVFYYFFSKNLYPPLELRPCGANALPDRVEVYHSDSA